MNNLTEASPEHDIPTVTGGGQGTKEGHTRIIKGIIHYYRDPFPIPYKVMLSHAQGWGSMMFSLSTEPPYDGVLAVSEMSEPWSVRDTWHSGNQDMSCSLNSLKGVMEGII